MGWFTRTRHRIARLGPVYLRWARRGFRLEEGEFAYHRQLAFGHILLLALLAFPVEVLLVLRVPGPAWLDWLVIGGSAIALIWLAGMYLSFRTLPHRVTRTHLLLRYGLFDELAIPLDTIERVAADIWDSPAERDGFQVVDDGLTAVLPVAHRTTLAIQLEAGVVADPNLPTSVRIVRFHADDAEALARAIAIRILPGT